MGAVVSWREAPALGDAGAVRAFATLAEATRVLLELRVGALPVVREGELVGILSVTDLLRAALPLFRREEVGEED